MNDLFLILSIAAFYLFAGAVCFTQFVLLVLSLFVKKDVNTSELRKMIATIILTLWISLICVSTIDKFAELKESQQKIEIVKYLCTGEES